MKSNFIYVFRIFVCVTALLLSAINLLANEIGAETSDGILSASTIHNTTFFVQTEIEAYSPTEYPPFRALSIRKGTTFELLAFDRRFSEFVTVRAKDGSIGYVPASAFADATLTIGGKYYICQTNSGEGIPDGKYSVVISGKNSYSYVYKSYNGYPSQSLHWSAQPKTVRLVGQNGTFDVTERHSPSYYERFLLRDGEKSIPIFDKLYSVYSYGQFDTLLNQLPQYYNVVGKYYAFDPQVHDLNEFIGHPRQDLEKIIGKPHAEVGHQLSGMADSTFAFYINVVWPVDKKTYNCGIAVSFDKDSNIGFIKQIPVKWINKHHSIRKLRFPTKPASVAITDTDTDNQSAEVGVVADVSGNESVEGVNHVSKSFKASVINGLKNLWDNKFQLYSETLGIYDTWAVLGIMLLIQVIFGIILTVLIYTINYGSDEWAFFRCLFLPMCLTVFNVIYFWKYVGFGSILAVPLFILAGLIPYFILRKQITDNRCAECRHYVNPEIIKTKEGNFHGKDYEKTARRELVDSWRSGGGNSMSGNYSYTTKYKYETRMRVTQDMEYLVKCPYCGHKWNQHREESRPYVRGPILIETIEKVHSYSTTVETTRTELRSYTNSVLDSREDTDYKTDSNTDTYTSRRYDIDRYHPYYIRYINGDDDALNRYYRDYWDDIS